MSSSTITLYLSLLPSNVTRYFMNNYFKSHMSQLIETGGALVSYIYINVMLMYLAEL